MAEDDLTLPNGLDWADGYDGRPGTPSREHTIDAHGYGGVTSLDELPIEEPPGSPSLERARMATVRHRFTMPWAECRQQIAYYSMGVRMEDSDGNQTKVLSARVTRTRADQGEMEIVAEGLNFDTPPDEFDVQPVDLSIHIMKHPRYFYAFLGDGPGSETELKNQMVIRRLQEYFRTATAEYRNNIINELERSIAEDGDAETEMPPLTKTSKISGTPLAKRAAQEIIMKHWRGEETPYLVGWQVDWDVYYARPTWLNPGGYVENPMTEASPQLPDYFYSTTWPPDPDQTVFDKIADYNPQAYSATGEAGGGVNISWLRKADRIVYNRTWFRVRRCWWGAPFGFWDPDLYNATRRPSKPDDYKVINAKKAA